MAVFDHTNLKRRGEIGITAAGLGVIKLQVGSGAMVDSVFQAEEQDATILGDESSVSPRLQHIKHTHTTS